MSIHSTYYRYIHTKDGLFHKKIDFIPRWFAKEHGDSFNANFGSELNDGNYEFDCILVVSTKEMACHYHRALTATTLSSEMPSTLMGCVLILSVMLSEAIHLFFSMLTTI